MSIGKMTSSDLDVWLTRTELTRAPEVFARHSKLLSPDELRRHASFRSEAAAHEYLVGRALVRTALSDYAAVPPWRWRFITNEHGRPQIEPGQTALDLRFNLSHTAGLIACVVAMGRDVGIDVESTAREAPVVTLARRFLSPVEADEVAALPRGLQQERFFAFWTLKESYAKALGQGLSLPLGAFSFRIGEDIRIETRTPDEANRWRFWLMRPTPSHTLALTAEFLAHERAALHFHHVTPLAA
jgi:4'-phosphopantetheinyl transferase